MDADSPSMRPYLLRAVHEWCTDHGLTPYLVVAVDRRVQVPLEYVRDGQIVLNISYEATANLRIDNQELTFKARFGGVAREVVIPIDHVIGIYARENGQGMAFPHPDPEQNEDEATAAGRRPALQVVHDRDEGEEDSRGESSDETPSPPPPRGGRPALKRVK
ncbi:Stringent starvation protein B [Tepidimonas alkaliphilus]|uniref:Stringent starvation protein B n=1 Tax=Tepidimonas alkaliphilus TaxID=2588942 RepID=A0A554W9L3_9BURK|nr:ClpXP protease specificity-enhancing factor [Tepidimonas alkaliphilus]TSE20263.1 Stringent starvation protein B [Tepidimonas alkaliphilus]